MPAVDLVVIHSGDIQVTQENMLISCREVPSRVCVLRQVMYCRTVRSPSSGNPPKCPRGAALSKMSLKLFVMSALLEIDPAPSRRLVTLEKEEDMTQSQLPRNWPLLE